jgi:hypothetical protein
MRRRLRPAYTDAELATIYATPHDHRKHFDHLLRVDVTIQVGNWLAGEGVGRAADLSCGNGMVLQHIRARQKFYGDFAPRYPLVGPLEQTLDQIPDVDLFVCSETLEHLDDPDTVLKRLRDKTRMLLLSTPDGEDDDFNPEHYWGWDADEVRGMLVAAGFNPVVHTTVDLRPAGYVYSFQIWGCQ